MIELFKIISEGRYDPSCVPHFDQVQLLSEDTIRTRVLGI